MNHPKLDQAREWTELVNHHWPEKTRAAAEVIQSLPDQWIDAEELRGQVKKLRQHASSVTISSEACYAYHRCAEALESLLTPPLPTLAEMAPEERKACKDMQAKTWHEVGIIVWVCELTKIAQIITRANGVLERKFEDVTPLPDLPKLEWPGSHADTITSESVEDMQAGRVVDFEPALPRPEDVPAGEAWIVQHEDREWIGCRNNPGTRLPWLVFLRDEHDFSYCYDVDITLVSRLVPETP